MKKIGEYTARGVVTEAETTAGTPQLIPLYDGSFKTAYRVTEFVIWGSAYDSGSNPDAIGKLSKNSIGSTSEGNFMRADDDNQIAWAAINGSIANAESNFTLVDADNLIVEDLYVYARTPGTNTNPINYYVKMDKYAISEEQGALLMARDRADGE